MSEKEQLRRLCAWNRELMQKNSQLTVQVVRLEAANNALGVELTATKAFLGAAIDDALEARSR